MILLQKTRESTGSIYKGNCERRSASTSFQLKHIKYGSNNKECILLDIERTYLVQHVFLMLVHSLILIVSSDRIVLRLGWMKLANLSVLVDKMRGRGG